MNKVLAQSYKDIPKFLPPSALVDSANQHPQLFVTEDITGDVVDIMLDKTDQEVQFRVNGRTKGSGVDFWKKHFDNEIGISYLLQTSPINLCIIRFSTAKPKPCFMKVLGIASVDSISKKVKWVPFHMVETFCSATSMSPMPVIFHGRADFEHIKSLVTTSVLGVEHKGIIVIPDGKPVNYIKIPVNVDDTAFVPSTIRDEKMRRLATEFADRAFSAAQFKTHVKEKKDLEKFIRDRIHIVSNNLSLMDYVNKVIKEVGIKEEEATIVMKDAIVDRCNRLWSEGVNNQAVVK